VNQRKKLKRIWSSEVYKLKENNKCNMFGIKEEEKKVEIVNSFGTK
jgi:hypothetical protein